MALVFGSTDDEVRTFREIERQRLDRIKFLTALAGDSRGTGRIVDLISRWGDTAPTLPTGAIVGLAHAGIGPDHDIGRKIIERGVPALSRGDAIRRAEKNRRSLPPGESLAADGWLEQHGLTADQLIRPPAASIGAMSDELGPDAVPSDIYTGGTLDQGDGGGIGGVIQRGIGRGLGAVGGGIAAGARGINQSLGQVAENVSLNRGGFHPQSANTGRREDEAAGITDFEGPKTVARVGFAGANDALRVVQSAPGLAAAATMTARGHPEGGTVAGPFGTEWDIGSISDALDPGQLSLVQAARGKSLGEGWLPGGPAQEAAAREQREAASVGGHALTVGRSIAGAISPQDSRVNTIVSGTADAIVATLADPSTMTAKAWSASAIARNTFAPTSEEAIARTVQVLVDRADASEIVKLREFAGADIGDDLIVALNTKIQGDYGSVSEAASLVKKVTRRKLTQIVAEPQGGVVRGLRIRSQRETALSHLNSEGGRRFVEHLAAETSFTRLRAMFDKTVPVDFIHSLAKADDVTKVRQLYQAELGSTVVGPNNGFKWYRPPEHHVRLWSHMPHGGVDLHNANQAVEQMEYIAALVKLPHDKWDAILEPLANPMLDSGGLADAWLHGSLNTIRDWITGVPDDMVEAITKTRDIATIRAIVPKKLTDEQAYLLMRAKDEDQARMILSDIVGDMPYRMATKLTRSFKDDYTDSSMFFTDQLGETPRVAGWVDGGEPVTLEGPFLPSELLSRSVPVPDARSLRQATTRWRQVTKIFHDNWLHEMPAEHAAAGSGRRAKQIVVDAEAHLSNWLTKTFKTVILAAPRTGLVILGDEQARMAAAGLDSAWSPMSYIGWVVGKPGGVVERLPGAGRKGAEDVLGVPWVDQLGDTQSAMSRAVAQTSIGTSPWSPDAQFARHQVMYGRDEPLYLDAWTGNLSKLHLDPVSREVGRAIVDEAHIPAGMKVAGLDGVKEWFYSGAGQKFRNNLKDARLRWGSENLDDRAMADWYIDQIRHRVLEMTGGDDVLMDAVAHGTPFDWQQMHKGLDYSVDRDFRVHLGEKMNDIGPLRVPGALKLSEMQKHGVDRIVTKWFGLLMDTPARVLSRSPVFKQAYWADIERMMPRMTREAQEAALEQADTLGVKLKASKVAGDLELETIDAIAKARGLAFVRDLLDYPGEKSNIEDMVRNIAPFATPWRDAISAWMKLGYKNPHIIRRGQQLAQQAQSSGFFHPAPDLDEKGGDYITIFGLPVTRWVTGATGFSLEGNASGLNIVSRGLPGVGYGVQVAAAWFVPRTTATQALHEFVAPYGLIDMTGGFIESMVPGFVDKIRAAGLMQRGGVGYGPTDAESVTLENLAIDAFKTMAASGKYDLSDREVLAKMADKARGQAQKLMLLRALGNAFVPTQLRYSAKTKTKEGRIIELFLLSEDYHKMLDTHKGDALAATRDFVDKYGYDTIFASQGKSRSTVFGLPVDPKGEQWLKEHGQFAQEYPSVVGYWVPQSDDFDYDVWADQVRTGKREPLTVEEWTKLAHQRLGATIYEEQKRRVGPSPNKAQREWLRGVKAKIQEQFPGYDETVPVAERPDTEESIRLLLGAGDSKGALDNPAVKNTTLARAARVYLSKRQEALTAMDRQSLTGESMERSRAWLRGIGTTLAERYPTFVPMWNNLLAPEIEEEGEGG